MKAEREMKRQVESRIRNRDKKNNLSWNPTLMLGTRDGELESWNKKKRKVKKEKERRDSVSRCGFERARNQARL